MAGDGIAGTQAGQEGAPPGQSIDGFGWTKNPHGRHTAGPGRTQTQPGKDDFGHVFRPARLGLQAMGEREPLKDVDASIGVWEDWLRRLKVGSLV